MIPHNIVAAYLDERVQHVVEDPIDGEDFLFAFQVS